MLSADPIRKPSNAKWIARVVVDPKVENIRAAPAAHDTVDHPFGDVDIAWYEGGVVKVTFRGAGPAVIRQAYLSGKGEDVILDLCPLEPQPATS